MAIVPLSLFYILCFLPLLFVYRPISVVLRMWIQGERQSEFKNGTAAFTLQGLPILPLSTATGIGIFLLLFSQLGRIFDSYFLILPLCYLLMGAGSFLLLKFTGFEKLEISAWTIFKQDFSKSFPLIAFFFILHLLLWTGRSFFSDIHFDPNNFGAEKLFNYHFQQSFTHGSGFPPQDLWLAGENLAYYILPKSLAGLASFFTRDFAGNPLSGGVLFPFSDTFFVALSSTVLASCTAFLLRRSSQKITQPVAFSFALFVGLVPLLAAPARAVSQAFMGNIDLWSLTRIIDNTINEYPFWNYLWADNHAHSSVLFLQITFMFWVLTYLSGSNCKKLPFVILPACLAPVILMSHSGSVLIDLVVIGTLGIIAAFQHYQQKTLKPFALTSVNLLALVVLLSAADYFSRGQPKVKWYLVPPSLSSTLVEFININQFMLGFLIALLLLVVPGVVQSFKKTRKREDVSLSVYFGLFVLSSGLGYPAVGMSLLLSGLGVFVLEHFEEKSLSNLRRGCLYAGLLMWIFPELVASNFDMGDKYMRYNSLFRFLFESFYVIPLLWIFAFAPTLSIVLQRKWPVRVFAGAALAALALFVFVQKKTFDNRVARVPTAHSIDGTFFLQASRPHDWALIQFLAHLPQKIVLAEECGMQPKPTAYSIAGRISAYSGRPALCGWSSHTQQFQYVIKNGAFAGSGVWDQLIKRNEWTQHIMSLSADKSPTDPAVQDALENFKKLGVTHLVFGEWEKQLHPRVQLASLARLGQVVFEQNGTGVIELSYAPITTSTP